MLTQFSWVWVREELSILLNSISGDFTTMIGHTYLFTLQGLHGLPPIHEEHLIVFTLCSYVSLLSDLTSLTRVISLGRNRDVPYSAPKYI